MPSSRSNFKSSKLIQDTAAEQWSRLYVDVRASYGRASIQSALLLTIDKLNGFWDGFAATTPAEMMLNLFFFSALTAQEKETPLLGVNAPIFSLKSIVLRKPRNSR